MPTILPFPTAREREVLRELDGLAAEFSLSAQQRHRVKARFLATIQQGRSTAVAVADARAELHQRPRRTNHGPSAA